jgi:hypothetical protein
MIAPCIEIRLKENARLIALPANVGRQVGARLDGQQRHPSFAVIGLAAREDRRPGCVAQLSRE